MRIVIMIITFAAFAAIVWWAYAPKRRARMHQAGQFILDEGEQDRGHP